MKRRLAACVLLGAFAFAAGPPPSPPKLVVLIVIDQLRYDYLTRFDDLFQGGFRRLLDEGAVFTNAKFRHGITLTSPGHASIATGRHPSQHGVTANYRYDPEHGKRVNAVFDPAEKAVGGQGSNSSPRILEAPTLADMLKTQRPGSIAVGVSLKDRSAILLAGKKADGAYWISADCGCLVTSTYYHDKAPRWLEAFNARKLADSYFGEVWKPFLEDRSLYEKYARADGFPSESDGREPSFPHRFRGSPPAPDFYEGVLDSALGDEIVLNASLAAINGWQLGDDDISDLLAISFAGVDRVGHVFGPFSQEAMDQMLRLDYVLGRLLDELDEQVGLDQTVIALTSDHGVMPLVEYLQQEGTNAVRFPKSVIPDAVDRAISEKYPGAGNIVAYFDPPHIIFDLKRLAELGISRAEAENLGSQAILATGYVEKVYRHSDFAAKPASGEAFFTLYRNSFYAPRSQHLIVRLKQNHYIDGSQGSTGHGSPYDYDRHVPIVFFGKRIPKGRFEQPAGPEDVAPTLARILGIEMAPDPDSRLLDEALR